MKVKKSLYENMQVTDDDKAMYAIKLQQPL